MLAGRKGKPSLLPFVGVLLVLLSLGLVGLLLLNTALNQGAFKLRQKQTEATRLTQQAEQYQQELAKLSEPGALASRAQQLGMVPAGNPAFLDPAAGTILGSPTPAASPTATATPTPSLMPSSSVPGSPSRAPGAPTTPKLTPTSPTSTLSPTPSAPSTSPTKTGTGR